MKINVYSVVKSNSDEFAPIIKNFQKMISRFSKIEDVSIFNKQIASSQQNSNELEAKKAYTKALEPHLKGFNIALDVKGKSVESFEFSKLITDRNEINFFIGGAYGFEEEFLKKCDKIISLSSLTFAHKVAKVVLYEQIYRGFTILSNHPYHKQ